MKDDTLVAVCCYAGDQHQVESMLDFHLAHGSQVVILSPEDSKATFVHPDILHKHGGKRAYIGQDSLDRQLAHLKILLTFPHKYFLLEDSDSVTLDADLPAYLYEKDVVWSNQVNDDINEHQGSFPTGWPHVAFQPPYFLSRNMVEKLVAAGESGHPFTVASPVMPFIDFYMVQLTMVAGLPWERLHDAISCPIAIDLRKVNPPVADIRTYAQGWQIATEAVRNRGVSVLHSIKNGIAVRALVEQRRLFLAENRAPLANAAPRVTG
jgi:hypothetical protein